MRPTKVRSSRDRMNNLPWTSSSFVLASSVGSSTELITDTCEVASSLQCRRLEEQQALSLSGANIHGGGNQLACWRALDVIMDDAQPRRTAVVCGTKPTENGRCLRLVHLRPPHGGHGQQRQRD